MTCRAKQHLLQLCRQVAEMQSRATNLALTHCPQPLMCRERAEQWAVEYARACLSDFKSILADAQVHALSDLSWGLGVTCRLQARKIMFRHKLDQVLMCAAPFCTEKCFLH